MNRYWYFAASLPGFSFGAPPPMEEADFLERVKIHLSDEDYAEVAGAPAALLGLELPGAFRSEFLTSFCSWERSFRNALAVLRAKALGKDTQKWIRPSARDDSAPKAAAACFSATDPQAAELALERERWTFIERLSALHTFDLDAIVAYRLRLAIAARLSSMSKAEGERGYGHLYADILGAASAGSDPVSPGVPL